MPDIGDHKLSSIRPDERTTPARRFVAALDRNLKNKEILWVNYDTAISLHPVITSSVKDLRAQRLASTTPLDNWISFGCINVPADFFLHVAHPAFVGTNALFTCCQKPARPNPLLVLAMWSSNGNKVFALCAPSAHTPIRKLLIFKCTMHANSAVA